MIRLKTSQDDTLLSSIVRKNKSFYKELNEINKRFFKEELKDELDWYRILLRSSYTMIWQEGAKQGIVASHLIFNEDDVINDGSCDPFEGLKKVYWYSFPENDKVEVQYISVLENHFKKKVEGVQINGSSKIIQTSGDSKESVSAEHETGQRIFGSSAKTKPVRGRPAGKLQRKTPELLAQSNGKDTVDISSPLITTASPKS